MIVTHLFIKNWRNFRSVEVPLQERTYVLGANASGKSNLLDVFRFLRDVSKSQGGGLQRAVATRGGITKLRCLHARRDPEVRIEVTLSEAPEIDEKKWKYILAFRPEGKGLQRTVVSDEQAWRGKEKLLDRPSGDDGKDVARLTQTHLEQVQSNAKFRPIADFFSGTTYLHLVPQLLKYGDQIGGQRLDDDPFGQGFLEGIARTTARTRDARLKKIGAALSLAVPKFTELRFMQDKVSGRPHLEARYEHFRPNAGWQSEEHFSDGTLRLLGLLWSLLDSDTLLLLEEPELSLNAAVIEQIPILLDRVLRGSKRRRQVIISTHSDALLSNKGIDGRGVLLLQPAAEGSAVRQMDNSEEQMLQSGFSIAEVMLPKARPEQADRLGMWG